MAILQLPVHSDIGNYEFKTDLEGTRFTFALRYNTRAARWIMDVKQSDGTILLAGLPLVLGTDLIGRFQDVNLPQGNLFLINLGSQYTECGRDDLGENCLLMYQEST